VILTASVDTEEDNWVPARAGITVRNALELPRMHERMTRLGLRLTYFCAHSIAEDPSAADVVRDLRAAGAEIGGHLHPWNTPPLGEAATPRNSMLKNLSPETQRLKIAQVTSALIEQCGCRPESFRAGRFALGTETVRALVQNGYLVDSSVMPWIDWSPIDEGADFFGAPQHVYRLGEDQPVTTAAPAGTLIEVPLSTGFNRWPFARAAVTHRRLGRGIASRLRLAGIAHRTHALRRIMLSPEGTTLDDMLRLARVLIRHGIAHLQIMWHSPTLVAGLTPFARSEAEVETLYRKVDEFVEQLSTMATIRFATVGETARLLDPRAAAVSVTSGWSG
jgi:hypothetical protein